jgi:anti-sigma B factor antagonist
VTFSISATAESKNRSVLIVTGELDLMTAGELAAAGRTALDAVDGGELVIDLARVTFLDSTAIGALVHLADLARQFGVALVLQAVPARVEKLLEITGIRETFRVDRLADSARC